MSLAICGISHAITQIKIGKEFSNMGQHLEYCTIYAVDFDGTLCQAKFPDIGAPNWKLIEYLIVRRIKGDKVILWTNRVGDRLKEAIRWCNDKNLYFDAVNENIPEIMELYKDILNGEPPSPKITADVFIDDAACNDGLPFNHHTCCLSECWNTSCSRLKSQQISDKIPVRPDAVQVKDLGLPVRLSNLLHSANIDTLYDLAITTENALHHIYGMGDRSIEKIREVLEKHGYKL